MPTRPDSRQVVNRAGLSQIGAAASSVQSVINAKVSIELDSPLRLSAAFPTPSALLLFSNSQVPNADGSNEVLPPQQGLVYPSISSASINFQTQALSNPSDFVITFPVTNTVGQFRRVGFSLNSEGKIEVQFSDEAASVGALPNPGSVIAPGIPLGYANLQCTSASGFFKTAGSATNVIENAGIVRFGMGGAGSGAATYVGLAGEALDENDAVYVSIGASDGGRTQGSLYKLDVTNPLRTMYAGLASKDYASGQAATIQVVGEKANFVGLPVSGFIYGSATTPGSWQTTPPNGSLQSVVILGQVSTDTTKILINAALSSISTVNGINPAAGYTMGGNPGSLNVIESLVFDTEVNSTISSTLPTGITSSSGASSTTKGYNFGGTSGGIVQDIIQTITFIGEATGTLGVILPSGRREMGTTSNQSYAYVAGGNANPSPYTDAIEKFTFTSETLATLVDTLSTTRAGAAGVSSLFKGYYLGGTQNGTGSQSVIDSLDFSTDAVSTLGATLPLNSVFYEGGMSAPNKGYALGGSDSAVSPTYYDTIKALTFNTESVTVISDTLSTTRYSFGTCWASDRGYTLGGFDGSTFVSVIERLNFTTESLSTLAAALAANKGTTASGVQG